MESRLQFVMAGSFIAPTTALRWYVPPAINCAIFGAVVNPLASDGGGSSSLAQGQRRRADQADVFAQRCRDDDQLAPVARIAGIALGRLPPGIKQQSAHAFGQATAADEDLRVEKVQQVDHAQAVPSTGPCH